MLSSFGIFVLFSFSFCFLLAYSISHVNHTDPENEVFMKTSSHPHQNSSFPKVMGLWGNSQLEVSSIDLECEDRLLSWVTLPSTGHPHEHKVSRHVLRASQVLTSLHNRN